MIFFCRKKQKNKISQPKKAGAVSAFMLIEALTLLFIFSLITVTFYSVFSVGLRYIQDAKNRLGALAIANEKIEIIRNLSYSAIGTDGGTIRGDIPQNEEIFKNTQLYHVDTNVAYIDDPFDGIGFADTVWFEDYKKVTITVSWGGGSENEKVKMVARFVPPGIEVAKLGDGILSVNVFSDQPGGSGIPNSRVGIYNPDTGINTYAMTDSSGTVTFMGDTVIDSVQNYRLTVTKSGYETVVTMPPYPTSAYDPVDVHASVVVGSMNVKNIVQNELANIRILTKNYLGEKLANADFHLVGGRKLGTDSTVIPAVSFYNLDEDGETDSEGEKTFSSVSPGGYNFSLVGSTLSDYEIINVNPGTSFFLLSADETLDVGVKLASKTFTSLLVVLLDGSSGTAISGATVRLTNTSLGYDAESQTTSDGKVFFPTTADLFLPGTYQIKITADGFSENNSDITINANELKVETISL